MSKRPFPVAAGLVLMYAGVVQSGYALSMLVNAFAYGFDKQIAVPALSLALALAGQIVMGYRAAARRDVMVGVAMWIGGALGTVYGFTLLDVTSLPAIAIGVLQLVGGPVAFLLAARTIPAPRTPARREIGALLLVVAIGASFGSVWNLVFTLRRFSGEGAFALGSLLGMSIYPAVTLLASVFAIRAARQALAGRASAARALTAWKWISLATSWALAVLSVASLELGDYDVPLAFRVQPLLHAALASVLPFALEHLGRNALAAPIEPHDARSVPTVYAWGALWVVPIFGCAVIASRMSFVSSLLSSDAIPSSQLPLVVACCGFAAIWLFVTAMTVLVAASIARAVVRVTVALSLCALGYAIYAALQIDLHDFRAAMLPVGSIAMFTAAMIALAWFEARREHDLAPARVIR